MFIKQRTVEITAIVTLVITMLSSVGMIVLRGEIRNEKRAILSKYDDIVKLQEELISAQITTNRLDQVQLLIEKNVALNEEDTLSQGASLQFLKSMTELLDTLKIKLVSLEPLKPVYSGYFIETPYRLSIRCNYDKLCQLENMLEKSSRLISMTDFALYNHLDAYSDSRKQSQDEAVITLELTTLTLLQE